MKQSESETFLFNRMFLYSNWLRVSKNLALYRRTSVLRMAHHINASGLDISPPIHRVGANVVSFDRSKFRKSFPILSARVPASSTHNLLKDQDLKRYAPVYGSLTIINIGMEIYPGHTQDSQCRFCGRGQC